MECKIMKNQLITLAAVIIGLFIAGQSHADTPSSPLPDSLKQGLVLYYDFASEPLDGQVIDTFDGKIVDKSDAHNDGTAVNVQWVHDEQRGGVASFGLNKSYITVPNNDSVNPPELTLSAWIKTSFEDRVWRRIFDKGHNQGYLLTMCGDIHGNSLRGQVNMEVCPAYSNTGQLHVTDGQWHHVVGTCDGTETRIYVDGRLVGKPQMNSHPARPTSYDLTIGADRSNPIPSAGEIDASFNGLMDDVMMWNRALSLDEVQSLYQAQSGALATHSTPSTPVAPNTTSASTTEKLRTLKQAFDQGLIPRDVYDQKVSEVLDAPTPGNTNPATTSTTDITRTYIPAPAQQPQPAVTPVTAVQAAPPQQGLSDAQRASIQDQITELQADIAFMKKDETKVIQLDHKQLVKADGRIATQGAYREKIIEEQEQVAQLQAQLGGN